MYNYYIMYTTTHCRYIEKKKTVLYLPTVHTNGGILFNLTCELNGF